MWNLFNDFENDQETYQLSNHFNNNLHFFTKSISIVYNIFGLYDFNVLNSKKEFVRVYEKFRLEFYEDIFPIAKQTGAPPCYNDVLSFDERFQLFPLK